MSRSLLKLVLALLVVGVLPFATSLIVVDGLFEEAVSVGLNPEVQAHLERSAEVHRELIETERVGHTLAAAHVAADRRWAEAPPAGAQASGHWREILASYGDLHPRLVALTASSEDDEGAVSLELVPEANDHLRRRERTTVSTPGGAVEIGLTFALPKLFPEELERVGATLRTFRALETLSDQLSRDMKRTYLWFAGGAALLSLLLGTYLTRRTTTRIGRIAETAARVGAGDLTARVRDRRRDEIGELSRQFNRMVDELQASQDRLAYLQRVSAWQEIARRLAHEIKNPLTPILLAMQQLDRKFEELQDQPERFRPLLSEALEIVEEEVETLRTLVKEFSQFGRMPEVAPEPLGVAGFVEDFVKTNPQLTQHAPIHVDVDEAARRLRANLDSTLMRRALTNLVQNAIDACADLHGDATDAIAITLRVWAEGEHVVVRLEDNGPGFDEAHLDRVFEPYFTTKKHGTGLGLPIVKKIVLDHGGTLELRNRPRRDGVPGGCSVTLRFPVTPAPSR
jgi:two-component system, NtrC family, nitrogen regulation sensor histidine kinase NtrY